MVFQALIGERMFEAAVMLCGSEDITNQTVNLAALAYHYPAQIAWLIALRHVDISPGELLFKALHPEGAAPKKLRSNPISVNL